MQEKRAKHGRKTKWKRRRRAHSQPSQYETNAEISIKDVAFKDSTRGATLNWNDGIQTRMSETAAVAFTTEADVAKHNTSVKGDPDFIQRKIFPRPKRQRSQGHRHKGAGGAANNTTEDSKCGTQNKERSTLEENKNSKKQRSHTIISKEPPPVAMN